MTGVVYILDNLPFYTPTRTDDHLSILGFNHIPLPCSLVSALIAYPDLFPDDILVRWTQEQDLIFEATLTPVWPQLPTREALTVGSVGGLTGRTVSIKWYVSHEHTLDIAPSHVPDNFLVLSGPMSTVCTSRGRVQPWTIECAVLFEAKALVEALGRRKVRMGAATSWARSFWTEAEIYPAQSNGTFRLSGSQRKLLELFTLTAP